MSLIVAAFTVIRKTKSAQQLSVNQIKSVNVSDGPRAVIGVRYAAPAIDAPFFSAVTDEPFFAAVTDEPFFAAVTGEPFFAAGPIRE